MVEDAGWAEDDHTGVDECRIAGESLALVQRANFRHFNADASIVLKIGEEMALVRPGVQIKHVALFLHVDEGKDVRPTVCIHRADMGGHMPSQELARIRISHLTFPTKHLAKSL